MTQFHDSLLNDANEDRDRISDTFNSDLGVKDYIEVQRAVGPYTPIDMIDHGGTGDVWLVRDPEGQLKAIKILKDKAPSAHNVDIRRSRFLREASILQELDHPNIVRVEKVNTYNGRLTFVMEYVEGTNLKNELAISRTIKGQRALTILDQMLDALQYAHEHGVIHRDVKPANILITERDKVKLCDFGIAYVNTSEMQLTQDGTVVGSYGYLSPEQAYCYPVVKQSDLFCVAIIAYEMITGTNPFWCEYPEQMLARARNPQVPDFTAEQLEGLPRGFGPTVMKALSVFSHQRPSSAAAFKTLMHTDIPAEHLYPTETKTEANLVWMPSRQAFSLAPSHLTFEFDELATGTGQARDLRTEAESWRQSLEDLNNLLREHPSEQVAYHNYTTLAKQVKERIRHYLKNAQPQVDEQFRLNRHLTQKAQTSDEQSNLLDVVKRDLKVFDSRRTSNLNTQLRSGRKAKPRAGRRHTFRISHDGGPRTTLKLIDAYERLLTIVSNEGFSAGFICSYLYLLSDFHLTTIAEEVGVNALDLADEWGDEVMFADCEMAIAYFLIQDGSSDAAIMHIDEALIIYERLSEEWPSEFMADVAFAEGQLAWCRWRSGWRRSSAKGMYDNAIDIYRTLSETDTDAYAAEIARLTYELELMSSTRDGAMKHGVSARFTTRRRQAVPASIRHINSIMEGDFDLETFGPALIDSVRRLALQTTNGALAKHLRRQSKSLAIRLAKLNPVEFDPLLSEVLMADAQFEERHTSILAALDAYTDASVVMERLSLESRRTYGPSYEEVLERMAYIQDALGFIEDAELTRDKAEEALIR